MENKEIVLNKLKELFHDMLTYEHPDTKVGKAYFAMSGDEELEVLEKYVRYRKNERANL